MGILYKEEHTACYMYDSGDKPLIEHLKIGKGERFLADRTCSQIVFLLKGKALYSSEYQSYNILEKGTFILLPGHYRCVVQIEEAAEMLLVTLHSQINFCNHFPLETLYRAQLPDVTAGLSFALKINDIISVFLHYLIRLLDEGFKCSYFLDLKQREILYYLRAYYSKEDLLAFFAPLLNSDIDFSSKIYSNYEQVKSIGELAKLTNYSMSGFKKRFIRVFGVSPSLWLQKEKSKKIYREINCTTKTFKELSIKYDFSSQAHFNSFCRKMYGMSPKEMRESTAENSLN